VVLPLLAVFALCLCWLLSLGIAHVRVVDAARDGARALARGEASDRVAQHVQRAAPGARAEVSHSGEMATVLVTREVTAPGWLLMPFPDVELRARAAVLAEGDRAAP
jgi:hypothetical protein